MGSCERARAAKRTLREAFPCRRSTTYLPLAVSRETSTGLFHSGTFTDDPHIDDLSLPS
jgi:hypothetical protein